MALSEKKIRHLFSFLREKTDDVPDPMVTLIIQDYGRDPFLILISCLLSLRARDVVTYDICKKLFSEVANPEEMLAFPIKKLEKIIKSIGFYHRKARTLHSVSKVLLERFDGTVPSNYSDLVSIKGIGPKTANLVLSEAFGQPAICVDTHVHRIANHLGLVNTDDTDETEEKLKKMIPKELWSDTNYLFVKWGQNICTPQRKKCVCPRHIIEDC